MTGITNFPIREQPIYTRKTKKSERRKGRQFEWHSGMRNINPNQT